MLFFPPAFTDVQVPSPNVDRKMTFDVLTWKGRKRVLFYHKIVCLTYPFNPDLCTK